MQIVHTAGHPDHHAAVKRCREVMARVGEKLVAPRRLDHVVEHCVGDVVEQVGISRSDHADLDHVVQSPLPINWSVPACTSVNRQLA